MMRAAVNYFFPLNNDRSDNRLSFSFVTTYFTQLGAYGGYLNQIVNFQTFMFLNL